MWASDISPHFQLATKNSSLGLIDVFLSHCSLHYQFNEITGLSHACSGLMGMFEAQQWPITALERSVPTISIHPPVKSGRSRSERHQNSGFGTTDFHCHYIVHLLCSMNSPKRAIPCTCLSIRAAVWSRHFRNWPGCVYFRKGGLERRGCRIAERIWEERYLIFAVYKLRRRVGYGPCT
jgi:hypothetical protein